MTDIPRPPNRLRGQPVETCRSDNPVGRRIGGRHDDRSASSGRDYAADSLQMARRAIIDSFRIVETWQQAGVRRCTSSLDRGPWGGEQGGGAIGRTVLRRQFVGGYSGIIGGFPPRPQSRTNPSPDFSQRVDFRVAEREGTGEHMKKAAVVG